MSIGGSGRNGPLFRDVQDRIDELADVLQAGNGVEASAARVADEELGAIREDGYGMGAERHVHAHAEGGIVVAQRLLKLLEMGNRGTAASIDWWKAPGRVQERTLQARMKQPGGHIGNAKGVIHTSPGQRPGFMAPRPSVAL